MARWIHEFRSLGERTLSEGERLAVRRRATGLTIRRWLYGGLAAVAFMSAFIPAMIALSGTVWVGPFFLPFVVFGFYAVSWSDNAEKLALLHRRVLRLGAVEEFHRVPGDETARHMWSPAGMREAKEIDEEVGMAFALPTNEYWKVDERFEENLKRSARGPVRSFTAVGRDGAILWVEGRPVRNLLNPPVWEVVG